MLAAMDARELDDWMAFERLEPFGDRVTQLMVAQLTALVANIVRQKGGRDVRVEDLMPRYVADKSEMDWREMKKRMQMLSRAAAVAATPPAGKKPAAGR